MKTKITNFFEWLLASLDNVNKGASGKKLTALFITIAYCYSHKFIDEANLAVVLGVDAGLILGLFGIGSYDKTKKNEPQSEN